MVKELLDANIIRESTSEYASPALLVSKKTGGERLCVDFRRLNRITKREHVPTPVIHELLDELHDNKYFTSLDLASEFYQIPIEEDTKQFTAFVTTDGQYELNKVPFGLTNAPSVFNRLMRKLIKILGPKIAIFYVDDILIASKTIEEGIAKLRLVLQALKEAGLTLKISKCKFLERQVEFVGFQVDADGVRPNQRNLDAIQQFKVPKDVKAVRQFIGLTSFFRRFIKDFALLTQPLTTLTRANVNFIWGNEQHEAFEKMKKKLTEKPILTLYDPSARHEIHTDASKEGVGAVLLQSQTGGHLKPVGYFSRQTTDTEARYHSYELEALAVVEAIERFKIYVMGKKFKVTDCQSLKTAMNKRDINPRIGRWWLKIQGYDIDLEHCPNQKTQHVDALSRNPVYPPREVEVADLKILNIRIDEQDWLVTMQLQDPTLQDIVEKINQEPTNNEQADP